MKNGTKMRFSLRKLSIGVCSVILGLTFIESTTQNVDADTNVQSDATEQVKSVSLATSTTNSENNQAKDQESSIDQDKQNSQSTDSDESRSLVDEKSNNLDESTLKNDTGQEKSYFDETAKSGSLNQEKVEQTSTTDNSSELSAKLEKNNANQDSQVLNTESVKVKTTYNKGVTQSNLYATMLYATSYSDNTWHYNGDTWSYSKGDGTQANTEWVVAPDGKWYYFDEDGEMAHDGWVDTRLHDGSWDKYYFDSNGHYAVNAKRKALIDAQNALSELKGKIKGNELAVGGASGFFKEIAENPNMSEDQKNDARVAYAIVNGELDAPSWYDKDVNLGQSNDATSVKNFYATLPYYDQYVKIRQKYNLSVPKVSLADVAVAMMDADYSTHVVDHARHYNTSENLAWNCADDPNGIWMGEESIWNKAVKKNPSLAQYKNDGYGLYQADSELFEQVGHYLNLIDPSTSSYGYALNTESNDYDNTESWDSGYGDPVFSVDEFKKLVTDYYNKMELPDQVKAAQAKVNKAKKDLA